MPVSQFPTLTYEQEFWHHGFNLIAGIDEAGRGCWAGPVTAGAVILPADEGVLKQLTGVRDSKLMTTAQREKLLPVVQRTAVSWAVGWATNVEIDAIGIVPATRLAMKRAVSALSVFPEAALIDAVKLPDLEIPQNSMKFGDRLSLSIAAASICAKVYRDRWMMACDKIYPGYGFAQHKGYGTQHHRKALKEKGACAIHRFSFRPLSEL